MNLKTATILIISFPLLSAFPDSLRGQNLNETVDYINDLLKLHTWNMHVSSEYDDGGRGYDQITVDSHGKIQEQRYVEDGQTGKISKGQVGYAYLNTLLMGNKKEFSGPPTQYKLYLVCSYPPGCVTYQFNDEGSSTRISLDFEVDDYGVRERLQNALNHLLDLAKNNKDFYKKDPFSN